MTNISVLQIFFLTFQLHVHKVKKCQCTGDPVPTVNIKISDDVLGRLVWLAGAVT